MIILLAIATQQVHLLDDCEMRVAAFNNHFRSLAESQVTLEYECDGLRFYVIRTTGQTVGFVLSGTGPFGDEQWFDLQRWLTQRFDMVAAASFVQECRPQVEAALAAKQFSWTDGFGWGQPLDRGHHAAVASAAIMLLLVVLIVGGYMFTG